MQPGLPAAIQAIAWLVVRSGQQLGQASPSTPARPSSSGTTRLRANVVLSDPTVSGLHAQIRQEHGRFVIYDLGSTNGTFLGGETGYTAAVQRQPLQDGDELRLGSVSLLFTTGKP
ncbi:MAG: FHA domain-containing protein [Caldilineales bacterium]|nr:FHA domain-containing protein [Caldilineales bacterium]